MTTKIQWTDETWNPVTGCSKVSPGCKHCYAERDWPRLAGNKRTVYYRRKFTDVQCHPEVLERPLHWRKPRRIFVNSMSDLFHEDVPEDFIDRVFAVMSLCPQHTFQVLTKRPERMRDYMLEDRAEETVEERIDDYALIIYDRHRPRLKATHPPWPFANVLLGVSVEDQATADERIPLLLQTPAAVRFVSYEPALTPVDFTPWLYCLKDIDDEPHQQCGVLDWLIVGGESGPKARPCDVAWIRSVVDQCKAAGVPCFVKQLGANPLWANTDLIPIAPSRGKGADMNEWPKDLRVREYPE